MSRSDDLSPTDRLRQEYAEGELDHDRNPTEDGFVEWLARRASAGRPTPHLDALKAERDRYASILAEIGDAVSPTGERPAEALGTLAADVRALASRLEAAHDALSRIDDGDDEAFNTLESTVVHVVCSYRAIATSEAQAADEIDRLRVQLNNRARNEARLVNAFESLTKDADGNDLDPATALAVGKVRHVLREAIADARRAQEGGPTHA